MSILYQSLTIVENPTLSFPDLPPIYPCIHVCKKHEFSAYDCAGVTLCVFHKRPPIDQALEAVKQHMTCCFNCVLHTHSLTLADSLIHCRFNCNQVRYCDGTNMCVPDCVPESAGVGFYLCFLKRSGNELGAYCGNCADNMLWPDVDHSAHTLEELPLVVEFDPQQKTEVDRDAKEGDGSINSAGGILSRNGAHKTCPFL